MSCTTNTESPASNGGRGLKPGGECQRRGTRYESPASNGGRGLKQPSELKEGAGARVARQQWRAWIETDSASATPAGLKESPASNGGRGLKLSNDRRDLGHQLSRPPAMAGVD